MKNICIQTNSKITNILTHIAKQRTTTPEAIMEEALIQYLQSQSLLPKTYSFSDIGESKKERVETKSSETLEKTDDLLLSAQSSIEFWDNPFDDEDWNDAS